MQSVKDFMQSYFREFAEMRAMSLLKSEPFRQKFFTTDHLKAYNRRENEVTSFEKDNPPTILNVDESEASAVVITAEVGFFGKSPDRYRYHLEASGESWLIRRHEKECIACKLMGKRGDVVCKYCKGTGWLYFGPPGV